jgi:hypothetical protein
MTSWEIIGLSRRALFNLNIIRKKNKLSYLSNRYNQSIYGSTALCWALALSCYLNLYTVGKTPGTGDQPVARPLSIHRKT